MLGRVAVVQLCLDNHSGCWVGKERGAREEAGGPWEVVQVSRGEGMMAWVQVVTVGWGEPEP